MSYVPPVLVVDDDLSLAQALTLSIESVGLPVEHCTTAEVAIELVKARHYGCIVLDLILEAGASGIYVVSAVRGLAPRDRPPVVMMTGATIENVRGIDRDIVKAILLKPLDLELFAQYVLATYRRSLDLRSAAGAALLPPPVRTFCGGCGSEIPAWTGADDNIFDGWLDAPCANCGMTPRDGGGRSEWNV
ncbi:MAG: response regulator [Thermoanaerobaculia bacterium]